MTDEEYQHISSTLGDSGFKIERIDETPLKSATASVSQLSMKSSSRSMGRKRSMVASSRTSTLPNKPSRGSLSEAERNEYRRLVQHIIRTHKMAAQAFMFPVPETVVGYYDIIKKPSDLTTIRQRLDSTSYLNRGEFEGDFLQMIWNAYIFNPPHSDVFRSAMELHVAFVTGLQKSVIVLNDLKRAQAYEDIEQARKSRRIHRKSEHVPSAPSRSALRKPTTEEELRKKLEFLQKVVARQQKSSTPLVPAVQTVQPLNDRQLDQLASDLEQLDPKYVPQVASVLRGEPTARIADGQLDLSIHELPPFKQRELQRLLEKIKAQEALRERLNERVMDHSDDERHG